MRNPLRDEVFAANQSEFDTVGGQDENAEMKGNASQAVISDAKKMTDIPSDHAKSLTDKALPNSADRPLIAVVDDSHFILESWKIMVQDADIMVFERPSFFWAAIADDTRLINRLSVVVTDYHFDNEVDVDGVVFAQQIKQKFPRIFVFLSSDYDLVAPPPNSIDAQIGKDPRPFAQLPLR